MSTRFPPAVRAIGALLLGFTTHAAFADGPSFFKGEVTVHSARDGVTQDQSLKRIKVQYYPDRSERGPYCELSVFDIHTQCGPTTGASSGLLITSLQTVDNYEWEGRFFRCDLSKEPSGEYRLITQSFRGATTITHRFDFIESPTHQTRLVHYSGDSRYQGESSGLEPVTYEPLRADQASLGQSYSEWPIECDTLAVPALPPEGT